MIKLIIERSRRKEVLKKKMFKKLLGYFLVFTFLFNYVASYSVLAMMTFNEDDFETERSIANNETARVSNEAKGNLEIDVKFTLPIYNKEKINMGVTLTDTEGNEIYVTLDNKSIEPMRENYTLGSQDIQVMVRKLDKLGNDLGGLNENEAIVYIGITVYGLKRGSYTVKLTGDGYKTFSESVTLDDYSKRMTIYDANGMFEPGDVNNDGVINDADVDLMIQNFGSKSSTYDLNRDGVADLADLNYITASLNASSDKVSILDTGAIVTSANVTVSGLKDGSLSDIFDENGSISIEPENVNAVIGEDNPAVLQVDLDNPVNAGEIRIETENDNIPTKMNITIVTESGKEINLSKSFEPYQDVHTFTDKANPNTIVINLDGQIAVKRVIITITETSSNNLADIAKVDFLNNVYESVPEVKVEVPTNVKVDVNSESFVVTYDNMRNITGYEILVEEISNGNVVKSTVYQTTYNEFTVTGLKNYSEYNVRVQSVNQEWKSGYGNAVTAKPLPNSLPPSVDMVTLTPVYQGFNVGWKDMKDTETYNLYYREQGTSDYKVIRDIKTNSYQLRDLKSLTTYEIYITGTNFLGEGKRSEIAKGTTKDFVMPDLINFGLINKPNGTEVTDHIKSVTVNSNHFVSSEYALVDNDFETYFHANTWDIGGFNIGQSGPIVEFDDFYNIDYIFLVPEDDSSSFSYVRVRYYDEAGNINTVNASIQSALSPNGQKYYKVTLANPVYTNKIQVSLANYLAVGSIGLREMKFYERDTLLDDVAALFKDDLRVELQDNVTEEIISALEVRANAIDEASGEYNPNRTVILSDLDYARKLMNDESVQDVILVDTNVSTANDGHLGFAMSISDLQPLGVVARPGEKLAIYVGSSNGDMPEVVFTQYFAEANVWQVTFSVRLHKGQNIIDVPTIGVMNTERGGSVYIRYPKASSNAVIKVRVSGGEKIPVLDLHGITDENVKREKISTYISEIESYVPSLSSKYEGGSYDARTSVLNSTEIVTDEGLFSIPASVVYSSFSSLSFDDKVSRILESTEAFDEMVNLFYRHKGLSDDTTVKTDKAPTSRINIRYMRMFAGAFMYAGGKHVGIGYESTAGLLTGKTFDNENFNGYFGWGISHEIGHQINQSKLVYAEITNNVYSLLAQTANDTSKSRLETSNIYPKIYEKVTSGTQGKASNVFVSLGMYWQLHLAYDDSPTFTDTNSIFARINKYTRSSSLTGTKDDLLVMYASDAAEENLIPFFENWGFVIGDSARSYVESKNYPLSKAIWYLNDEARRYRMNGGTGISSSTTLEASYASVNAQEKVIKLDFSVNNESDKILGYEIKRNGEVIGFTTDSSYTDVIGAMNNRAVKYEVTAYDYLLNTTNTVVLEEIKISHNGSINKSNFSIESNFVGEDEIIDYEDENMDFDSLSVKNFIDSNESTSFNGTKRIDDSSKDDAYVIIELNSKMNISGIRYVADDSLDNRINEFEVYVSKDKEEWIKALSGTFTGEDNLLYFENVNDTGGNQIWTYSDVSYVKLVAVSNKNGISGKEIDLISPPSDNIDLDSNMIGVLSDDYCYDANEECLKAGSIIIKGNYTGNPAFNVGLLVDANDDSVRYSGEQLFFAKLTDSGNVYEVANGIWIYALTEEEYVKMEGKRVRAVLYRVDDALNLTGQRITSTSLGIDMPKLDELDYITIEN